MNFQGTNLSLPDILIVVAYLAICLVIGLQKAGKIKTIRDYTLGFKPFSTGVLIATTFATAISSYNTIGFVGKAYELGLVFILPSLFAPLSWFIMAKLFAPNLEYFHQKKFISFSEIMEHWYGKSGRWVTNIGAIIVTLGVTAASILAIGYLLHYFLKIPEFWGMSIGLFVVTTYSASGGVQSVARTDVLQFLIFFVIIPVACAVGVSKIGGIEKVFYSLPETHITIKKSNILLFSSFLFFTLIPYTGIPYVQRALISKDNDQFKKAFTISGILMLPLLLAISCISLVAYKLNPNLDSNVALFDFVDHNVPSVIKGLMIAGLLSVIMSTQDSYLNTTSSLIAKDICKQIWPQITNKKQLAIARVSCVLISLFSIFMAMEKQNVLNIEWLICNFWTPVVTIPFFGGLVGARISEKQFLILVALVFIMETAARYITGSFDTISLMVGIITSVVVLLIGHLHHRKKTTSQCTPNPVSKEELDPKARNIAEWEDIFNRLAKYKVDKELLPKPKKIDTELDPKARNIAEWKDIFDRLAKYKVDRLDKKN